MAGSGLKYFGRYSEQLPTRIFSKTSISNKLPVYSFVDEELKKVEILPAKAVTAWTKKEDCEIEACKMNFRIIIVLETFKGLQE